MTNEKLIELKKWIEEQKEVSRKGYNQAENNELKTMYSCEKITFDLVIIKIDKMLEL